MFYGSLVSLLSICQTLELHIGCQLTHVYSWFLDLEGNDKFVIEFVRSGDHVKMAHDRVKGLILDRIVLSVSSS